MKRLLFFSMLLPLVGFTQHQFYLSADAGINVGKSANHIGYNVSATANRYFSNYIALGVSTGLVKLNPFAEKISIPLVGRISYDGGHDETKTFPIVSVEAGKLFHNQKNFGGVSTHTFKGRYHFLAAAGIGIASEGSLKSTITLGFAGYYYQNEILKENSVQYVHYDLHRIVLRIGLMLLR